jgi:hypothetical protein
MTSLIDRGADHLLSANRIGSELCASLKAEVRRRVAASEFFGFIGFVSLRAAKPASETATKGGRAPWVECSEQLSRVWSSNTKCAAAVNMSF